MGLRLLIFELHQKNKLDFFINWFCLKITTFFIYFCFSWRFPNLLGISNSDFPKVKKNLNTWQDCMCMCSVVCQTHCNLLCYEIVVIPSQIIDIGQWFTLDERRNQRSRQMCMRSGIVNYYCIFWYKKLYSFDTRLKGTGWDGKASRAVRVSVGGGRSLDRSPTVRLIRPLYYMISRHLKEIISYYQG